MSLKVFYQNQRETTRQERPPYKAYVRWLRANKKVSAANKRRRFEEICREAPMSGWNIALLVLGLLAACYVVLCVFLKAGASAEELKAAEGKKPKSIRGEPRYLTTMDEMSDPWPTRKDLADFQARVVKEWRDRGPKLTLTFDENLHRDEIKLHFQALDMRVAIDEVRVKLREWDKYESFTLPPREDDDEALTVPGQEMRRTIAKVREEITNIFVEHGVLDD